MFGNSRRRRNKIMDDFNQSQFKNYTPAVKVVNNKLRFNKTFQKNEQSFGNQGHQISNKSEQQRNVMIRKYKIGELPDIQITTQDIIDPMLFLANHDH